MGESVEKCCEMVCRSLLLKTSTPGWLPVPHARVCSREEGAAVYLTGTFERNLDAKGRLSLPASLRKEIDEERVYVMAAPEKDTNALYVYTQASFQDWVEQVFASRGGYKPNDREDVKLRRLLNAAANALEIDSAARISLPEALRSKKGLGREVTVVGNTDHFEIWDRAAWEAMNDEAQDDLDALLFG